MVWASSNVAFKEWAVVVDALGHGEQAVILRKGGIRETRGEFHVDHREFWLFPTQYHEAEHAIIPSKRPVLRDIAARASRENVDIEFYAVADPVLRVTDSDVLSRFQGRHIWTEATLQQRFEFGRERGLHVLIVRVHRLAATQRIAIRKRYGGCNSWIELEQAVAGDVTPVLSDTEFAAQRDELCELISGHALTHS